MVGSAGRNGLRVSVSLSVLTAGQLLTSFGIQWYTIARLGAGAETDALYAGSTLLQLFSAVVMEPLSFVLVPLLSARAEAERRLVAWPLFIGVAVLFASLTLGLFGAVPYLVSAMVPGFSESTRELAIELTRIQLTGLVGVACSTVLAAFYHARNQFLWTGSAFLLCSLIGWCVLFLGLSQAGVTLAAWVQVFMCGGPAVLLLKIVGGWPRASIPVDTHFFRDLWTRMRPLVLSAAYLRTGFLADRFLTSFLAPGSLVILELTWRVLGAMVRVLNQAVVTPVVPTLAKLAEAQAWETFATLSRDRLRWMGVISGVALAVFLLVAFFGQNIGVWMGVRPDEWALTGDVFGTLRLTLLACAGMLVCGGLNHVLVNAFYAEGEMSTPAKVEALASTAGLLLKGLGFFMGGLMGIALAISMQYALTSVLLGSIFYRRLTARLRECGREPVKPVLAVGTSQPPL